MKVVKISKGVRKVRRRSGLTESEAVELGMQEKRKEFLQSGARVDAKLPAACLTREVVVAFAVTSRL